MTRERAKKLIDSIDDDSLIDMATTCSNRGIALKAEIEIRKRYPSRIKALNRKRGARGGNQ